MGAPWFWSVSGTSQGDFGHIPALGLSVPDCPQRGFGASPSSLKGCSWELWGGQQHSPVGAGTVEGGGAQCQP